MARTGTVHNKHKDAPRTHTLVSIGQYGFWDGSIGTEKWERENEGRWGKQGNLAQTEA